MTGFRYGIPFPRQSEEQASPPQTLADHLNQNEKQMFQGARLKIGELEQKERRQQQVTRLINKLLDRRDRLMSEIHHLRNFR